MESLVALYRATRLVVLVVCSTAGCSHTSRAAQCSTLSWQSSPAALSARTPFAAVDRRVAEHAVEKRGFVTVPLDYADPDGRSIDIFYRALPAPAAEPGAPQPPVLVVVNGGPGAPSSGYRSLEHDYGAAEPDDALGELAARFRVIMIDQRGTGNSAPLDLDDPSLSQLVIARLFDSDEHARDHARVIDTVVDAGEPFFILARSYGGHIGFQYLALGDAVRQPTGFVFSSALLPRVSALDTFTNRRAKQRELNLALRASHPRVVDKLERLADRLQRFGADPALRHTLWTHLGKGEGWESGLDAELDRLLSIDDRDALVSTLRTNMAQTVNLLNYVLSSAALTPGYTDRSMTAETERRVPFEAWMLDENWTLRQIGNDGGWRERFVCAVDRSPPPPTWFPDDAALRAAIARTQVLFTFGATDALLAQAQQLEQARRYQVDGHTTYRVLAGGHGAAFSAEGAEVVGAWAAGALRGRAAVEDGSRAVTRTDSRAFEALMRRVAHGWSTSDTMHALGAFTDDAVYSEPPNLQLYRGREQIARFFDAVTPGSSMIWHRLWYDEQTSIGAGEYSFHKAGRPYAVHGVAVVELREGKIAVWREYQRRGAVDFDAFLDIGDKVWETTGSDAPTGHSATP